jgi:anti-sigma regulatory factor (Ser/Thr protein kinase)
MPFHALPAADFVGRQIEMAWLKRLARTGENTAPCNVILEGARGIGKTELLKQVYRSVFWEENSAIPFYYSFSRANLRVAHFAGDYFTRFLRQYIACLKQDPSLAENTGAPLTKLYPIISSLKIEWLIDLVEDFQEVMKDGDIHAQMLTAVSAPVTAAIKTGRPILIMLDDFPLSSQLYASVPSDTVGLVSLFDEAMRTSRCPHIITGAPEGALESILGSEAFRGKAERMFLGTLPDDASRTLFLSICSRQEITVDKDDLPRIMQCLNGSPLYLRNMARAMGKTQKKKFTEQDIWECYSHEVSEGDTAFYWSSVLFGHIKDREHRRIAVELLTSSLAAFEEHTTERQARILGITPSALRKIEDDLEGSGIVRSGLHLRIVRDSVLIDSITSLAQHELENKSWERIREAIVAKYLAEDAGYSCFEMVIPADADAELVAARAVEQIGKNLSLSPEVINHLQIALIESCINAMEHSGSHEKKVFLKVTLYPEKIEIAIESPGKFFDPDAIVSAPVEAKLNSGNKRGWGLKLMRMVMDEVKVDRIGEKTRVTLIKKIKINEGVK